MQGNGVHKLWQILFTEFCSIGYHNWNIKSATCRIQPLFYHRLILLIEQVGQEINLTQLLGMCYDKHRTKYQGPYKWKKKKKRKHIPTLKGRQTNVHYTLPNHRAFWEISYMQSFKNPHPRILGFIDLGWGEARNIDMREKHQGVVSHMCPNRGLNPQPFGVWDNAPTDWATWPRPHICNFVVIKVKQ